MIIMVTLILASFLCVCVVVFFFLFRDWENVENFRFDIFLTITQKPQDIMEILINWIPG